MKKAPNSVDVHVGARVRQARMVTGKSQEWLGNALDLTFQQVQKYEKGANRIGASRMQQIAHALGYPVSWFFEGQGEQGALIARPDDPFDTFASSREGLRVARAFNSITDDKIRHGLLIAVEACAMAFAKETKKAA